MKPSAAGGLAWKLNRLRCMSAAEIGHRVVKAAAMRAERWGFARCNVPAPDLSHSASPWIHRDARVDAAPYVASAERILAGRYDVFALEDVDLGNPPRWNRDPKTGVDAPLDFGKQLDYRDEQRVGDCKYLWEPNRHLHLATLAQAYALTGEMRFADAVRVQLDSWFAACPFRMGPNWSSSLEAGLRLVNWSAAWHLLGGAASRLFEGEEGERFRQRWLVSAYQHCEFIAGHLSLHSSANNHLIGEVSGLYMACVTWPHWERSKRWGARAKSILEREALLQNAPDGVNREQAVSYQQWEIDLLMLPLLAARAEGGDFTPAYVARIESMLEYVASIMDAGGNLPMFGDADDGFVVRLDPREGFCRFRSQLATGAILFGRGDFKAKAGRLDDKTRWLLGPRADPDFDAIESSDAVLPVRREFPDGGYYVMGCDFETPSEIRLVADAGPLGYREIAAHGHADALSFTLSLGGEEFLIDPGTFAYHTQPEWRAYFRGTSAHNTLRIDGRDQSQPGGNFMWLRKARAGCSRWTPGAAFDFFEGWHDGYRALPDPVTHRRAIALDKAARRIVVEDTLEMAGRHEVELFLHCHEDCVVEADSNLVRIARGANRIEILLPEAASGEVRILRGSTHPRGGWSSRAFDRKQPCATIAWRARLVGRSLLRTTIECAAMLRSDQSRGSAPRERIQLGSAS
ncbi:MAG TPA: alginate lyase family protein [Usitatibacter sp.]|nr:alginate lyase family protein [Usitatibacter sp.]